MASAEVVPNVADGVREAVDVQEANGSCGEVRPGVGGVGGGDLDNGRRRGRAVGMR